MKDELPLRCEMSNGEIDMGIGKKCLAMAARHHPDFYDPDRRPDGPNIPITALELFAEDVVAEINRESEDGSTLLTNMLDKAMTRAVENGSEGVDFDALDS